MGGCASCNAAVMTEMEGTAKVVLPDGGLLEYDRSVTAGSALGKDSSRFFVCDADEMEIGRFLSAVSVNQELCSGQLYFVLPRSMLNYPLRAEDLAALAVKASTALIGAAGLCDRRAVAPLFFPVDNADRRRVKKEKQDWQRRSPRNGIKGPKFSPELIAIPE
ncbi:uncharacterized protein LOC121991574 [Zingiber officinale]|nr:uncharacterized protein LOC121991574 [Zingiber officinale]